MARTFKAANGVRRPEAVAVALRFGDDRYRASGTADLPAEAWRLAHQGTRDRAGLSERDRRKDARPVRAAWPYDWPPRRAGQLADGGGPSADRAGAGEPAVAASLRSRPGGDAERFRCP